MSHEKLKKIRIDKEKHLVVFFSKSNNDTSDYREQNCDIPTFLNLCAGNCFQHSNTKINDIVNSWTNYVESNGFNTTDVFFDIEWGKIDQFEAKLREEFYKHCDLIANLKLN